MVHTIFLDMPKEEEAALLAMLPQHAPMLKGSTRMRIDQASGDVFDAETGCPAVSIALKDVSFTEAPIPRKGPEATVIEGGWPVWQYGLSKASGRWVVIDKRARAID